MPDVPAPPAPLVRLSDVSVARGGVVVLRHLDFTLSPGEAVLLEGPNGGGKSTFLGLLRGDLAPLSGTRTYVLDGAERVSAVRAKRAFVPVSPEGEAFYLTRDIVQTGRDVLLSGLSGDALNLWPPDDAGEARLVEVAALTGVEALLTRDIRTLSHGQRRRVLLARALMPAPTALLLDEFTDGLSLEARAELRPLLERVAASGVALLLATHRPEEAPALAWRRLRLEGGRLEDGRLEEGASVAAGTPDTARPRLGDAGRAPHRTGEPLAAPERSEVAPLVVLERAEVYRGGRLALGPLDWTWSEGQHWLVTGGNGAGKSTLARTVAGELFPALGGHVSRPFLRREFGVGDLLSERRRHIGVVGAELSIRARGGGTLERLWTGREVIASAFSGSEGFAAPLSAGQEGAVERLAARLGLTALLPRRADTLSQGQLGRLLLARAVVHRPRLLLLDEGMNFLDADSRARFQALLPELMAGGTHLLVVAHRASDVPPGLTHHLELENGRVLALSGPPGSPMPAPPPEW